MKTWILGLVIVLWILPGCKPRQDWEQKADINQSKADIQRIDRMLLVHNDPNWTQTQYRQILRRLTALESDSRLNDGIINRQNAQLDALEQQAKYYEPNLPTYDPNDPAYRFITPAPKEWTDKFGDNERTRLLHSISELRVVVAAQGKRILALEDWQKKQTTDPNTAKAFETLTDAPAFSKLPGALFKDPNEVKR